MNSIYWTFGIALLVAIIIDLGLLSKKHQKVTFKKAIIQTIFWVVLSFAFCAFLYFDKGSAELSLKYTAAYLMEWSLSIDNIFVFLLIFSFFRVDEADSGRALLIGILLAILFRIAFISLGIGIIERFHWVMYLFGIFLLYTGFKLFRKNQEEEFDPGDSKIYQWTTRLFRISDADPNGRFFIKSNGKILFTKLSLVVLMLAATDIVFALDSIPTVVSLVRDNIKVPFTSEEKLIIYSSNIFAVLGLRSLFFLLKNAIDKFKFLQQGIAVVLVFIGIKMLIDSFFPIPIYVSLIVIVVSIFTSIAYSIKISNSEKVNDDIY